MATQRSYEGFFIGTMILATGTAIFKPGIQGSLAQSLDKSNSSKGWGIFYWLVNVGAMMGPPLAGILRSLSWPWVFYGCAMIVSLNYLMMFTYADPKSGYVAKDRFLTVFKITLQNMLDARLLTFLLIMSGFWLMMYQLWDLHPNFIADWVDSRRIVELLPVPSIWTHETDRGIQVLQENLLNLNAFLIVVLVIPISMLVARMRTLSAMLLGMIVASVGIVAAGLTMSGFMLLLGIVFFSLGEMLTGPKKNEYLGLIAPEGKKGLYLGYVNIPIGIGGFIGSKLAGYLYGNYGEKAVLAQRYLAEKSNFLESKGLSPWDGSIASLTETLGIERNQAYAVLKSHLDLSGEAATRLLWETYQPYHVWFYFAAIGLVSTIALVVFNQRAKKWKDMNV